MSYPTPMDVAESEDREANTGAEMGEVADMMLDGTLCEGCGVYLGADWGPTYCPDCARERARDLADPLRGVEKPPVPRVACPVCSKSVKVTGIGDHWRQCHEVKA